MHLTNKQLNKLLFAKDLKKSSQLCAIHCPINITINGRTHTSQSVKPILFFILCVKYSEHCVKTKTYFKCGRTYIKRLKNKTKSPHLTNFHIVTGIRCIPSPDPDLIQISFLQKFNDYPCISVVGHFSFVHTLLTSSTKHFVPVALSAFIISAVICFNHGLNFLVFPK